MAPIANLTVRISAQIAEFQKSFAETSKDLKKFGDEFEGTATRAAAVGSFLGNIGADIAKSFAAGIGSAIKDSIRLSQEFNNAFIGLGSVAKAFGQDVDKVKAAAKGLSSDGLLPLKDSATGLKNLLSAGFGLEQSVKLMGAFKDSAAFGRQSALSFGDAVRGATEGVKNGNSALVDNSGVTKNLSVILKEAGFQMQDLADKVKGAGARQALYNGILRETAAQQGDAAKAANTYTGQMTALSTAYDTLLATWGDAITQNKTVADTLGAVGAALRAVTGAASDNRSAFLFVSDAIVFLVRAFASVVSAVDSVQSGFATLQVASNQLFIGLSEVGIAIFKFQEKAAGIAQFLDPVNATRHAAAVREARDAYTFLSGAVDGFKAASDSAETRQAKFSSTLQGISAKASDLATELAKTRGQVVELGNAGGDKPLGALPEALAGGGEKAKGFALSLQKLTADIDRAVKAGKEMPELMARFGSAASKASIEAVDWRLKVSGSVKDVARAFNAAQFEKAFDKIRLPDLTEFAVKSGDQFGDNWIKGIRARFIELPKTFGELNDGLSKFGSDLAKKTNAKLAAGLHEDTPRVVSELTDPFRTAFAKLGEDLPQIILSAIQGGGNVFAAAATGAATVFATSFRTQFDDALKAVSGDFSKLSAKNKALGIAATGVESFTSGFALGQGLGKGKGALAGAATGAAIGANPALSGSTLGISIAVGAGVGALAGFLGGRAADKKAKAALEENKVALAQQFGGMAKLNELATKLGVNIQKAFDAKKPAQFQAAVDQLNAAIEAQNKRTEGLAKALEAVNSRAATFAKQFSGLVATKAGGGDEGLVAGQKLQELAQRTQPEFERLGLFIKDTFSGIVKDTGNVFDAITQLAPAFQTLKSGVTDFGLTSTAVIDSLIGTFDLVTNEAFAPFFENIQASGQLLKGLFDAKALSPETFQAVAADIGQSIQEIANRGGDMSKALALSQPVLQTLWEAQQTFGQATDQTTQSILDQAEQQGLVGAQFKATNEKILDVLFEINKVLGGDIPESMQRLSGAAKKAGDDISNELGKIKTPDLKLDVTVDLDTSQFDAWTEGRRGLAVPALASGGIVRRPTLALIGERGPEAVVPLSRLSSVRSSSQAASAAGSTTLHVTINGDVDSDARAERIVKDFARIVRRGGAPRTLALESLGVK